MFKCEFVDSSKVKVLKFYFTLIKLGNNNKIYIGTTPHWHLLERSVENMDRLAKFDIIASLGFFFLTALARSITPIRLSKC